MSPALRCVSLIRAIFLLSPPKSTAQARGPVKAFQKRVKQSSVKFVWRDERRFDCPQDLCSRT